jgi:hypothetical protein
LNNLFKETQMQDTFGVNMVALVDGQPRLLNLKQMLEAFLRHRREVVTRRTVFELRKARERGHILEGLAVALSNVDEIIALIKASASPAEARQILMSRVWSSTLVADMLVRVNVDASRPDGLAAGLGLGPDGYRLSEAQAQRILEMQLQGAYLEQDKIAEYRGNGPHRRFVGYLARLMHHAHHRRRADGAKSSSATSAAARLSFTEDLRSRIHTPAELVVTLCHRVHEVSASG